LFKVLVKPSNSAEGLTLDEFTITLQSGANNDPVDGILLRAKVDGSVITADTNTSNGVAHFNAESATIDED
jgi:hypothetical protein